MPRMTTLLGAFSTRAEKAPWRTLLNDSRGNYSPLQTTEQQMKKVADDTDKSRYQTHGESFS